MADSETEAERLSHHINVKVLGQVLMIAKARAKAKLSLPISGADAAWSKLAVIFEISLLPHKQA
jgi:hypothetical protein